jgi:hypothetical protein
VYTLRNPLLAPRGFRVEAAGADWLTVTPAAGVVAPGDSVDVTIGVDETVAGAFVPGSYAGRMRIVADPAGTLEHEVDVQLVVFQPKAVITAIAPNPSRGLLAVHYRMGVAGTVRGRVYDMRGRLVGDLGSWTAAVGDETRDWVARRGDGGQLPGGLYVLELEAGGQKSRRSFTILR